MADVHFWLEKSGDAMVLRGQEVPPPGHPSKGKFNIFVFRANGKIERSTGVHLTGIPTDSAGRVVVL